MARRHATASTLIVEAIRLLQTPLPHEWADCEFAFGPFCPRCALARAATNKGRELAWDALDGPLLEAVWRFAQVIPGDHPALTEAEAVAALGRALQTAKVSQS